MLAAILPVFVLAFVVVAIVSTDYHTRRVSLAMGMVPSMGELARELYESAVVDGAHARMMRRAVSPLAVSLDTLSHLSAPQWAVPEVVAPRALTARSIHLDGWERSILAVGAVTVVLPFVG